MSNTLDATLNPADAVLPQAPLLTAENTPLEREYLPTPGYKSAMRQRASKSRIRLTRIYGVEIEMALGEDPLRSLGIWERLQRGEEVRGTLQFDDETGEFGFHESPLGKRIRLSKTGHQGQLRFAPTTADVLDLLIGPGRSRTVTPLLQQVQLSPDDESVAMLTWSCVESTVSTAEQPMAGAVEPGADEATNITLQ